MSDDLTVRVDSEEYVVRREGDDLQVGRRTGGDVAWLDTVDPELLSQQARVMEKRSLIASAYFWLS